MKGTEKQIAWATDIINAPVNGMNQYANYLASSRISSQRAVAESLTKAIDAYTAMVSSSPIAQDASLVISNRNRFSGLAAEVVRRTLIADGIHPSETLANLRNYM